MQCTTRIALLLFVCVAALCRLTTANYNCTTYMRQDADSDLTYDPGSKRSADPTPNRLVLIIDVSRALHITTPHYISLAIDSNQIRKGLKGFDFCSKKLINMAAALSPTNIRFGGTYADFLHFDPNGTLTANARGLDPEDMPFVEAGFVDPSLEKNYYNFTLTGKFWDNITTFTEATGWEIMWDFNLFIWKDGLWDPSNAKKFLQYSAARGIKIPSFQLGNEPNGFDHNFNFTIAPDILAKDFKILRDVLAEFPLYSASALYGPENTNMDGHGSSRNYLTGFLKAGGCDLVNEIGVHHYYLNGKTAKPEDFLDPAVLDSLQKEFEHAYNITWGICRMRKRVRLTETSSCYGGGAPGLSDRYAAGFLWLDKLGLAAKNGITHLFRQSFWGGRYSLITTRLGANPDYWLTLLYKRLVEGPVFHVVTDDTQPLLRLYAHCVRKDHYQYPDGAMVVYYLNLARREQLLSLQRYQNSAMHLFMLTAGDRNGLKSRTVKLNGRVIYMNGSKVPDLQPKTHSGDIPVTPQSFGFIVIPGADVPLCKIYHQKERLKRQAREYRAKLFG